MNKFKLPILVCSVVFFMSFSDHNGSKALHLESQTHTVTIFRMKYNPQNLTVKKGDTVVWINKDFVPHDVTEETNKKWTSKPFNKGEKWAKVITEDVNYFCDLHKVMKGTITIIN